MPHPVMICPECLGTFATCICDSPRKESDHANLAGSTGVAVGGAESRAVNQGNGNAHSEGMGMIGHDLGDCQPTAVVTHNELSRSREQHATDFIADYATAFMAECASLDDAESFRVKAIERIRDLPNPRKSRA